MKINIKLFIDLTGQVTLEDHRYFAWLDTSADTFERHSDNQIWENWDDFAADYEGQDLERYRKLCPAWVFEPEEAPTQTREMMKRAPGVITKKG